MRRRLNGLDLRVYRVFKSFRRLYKFACENGDISNPWTYSSGSQHKKADEISRETSGFFAGD